MKGPCDHGDSLLCFAPLRGALTTGPPPKKCPGREILIGSPCLPDRHIALIDDERRLPPHFALPISNAMSSATRPEPWHRIIRLKDELWTGELSLAEFAADLYEVVLAQGRRPVYEDPEKFFALTYSPTRFGSWSGMSPCVSPGAVPRPCASSSSPMASARPIPSSPLPPVPLPRWTSAARSPGRAGVPRARGHRLAQGTRRHPQLRQDRRGEGNRKRTGAGWRGQHAPTPLERAGLPACRRGGLARDSRRRQGRGTRDPASRALPGQARRGTAAARSRHPDLDRRSTDVRARGRRATGRQGGCGRGAAPAFLRPGRHP